MPSIITSPSEACKRNDCVYLLTRFPLQFLRIVITAFMSLDDNYKTISIVCEETESCVLIYLRDTEGLLRKNTFPAEEVLRFYMKYLPNAFEMRALIRKGKMDVTMMKVVRELVESPITFDSSDATTKTNFKIMKSTELGDAIPSQYVNTQRDLEMVHSKKQIKLEKKLTRLERLKSVRSEGISDSPSKVARTLSRRVDPSEGTNSDWMKKADDPIARNVEPVVGSQSLESELSIDNLSITSTYSSGDKQKEHENSKKQKKKDQPNRVEKSFSFSALPLHALPSIDPAAIETTYTRVVTLTTRHQYADHCAESTKQITEEKIVVSNNGSEALTAA